MRGHKRKLEPSLTNGHTKRLSACIYVLWFPCTLINFTHPDTAKHISVRRGENGRVNLSRRKLVLDPSPSQPLTNSETNANTSNVFDDAHLPDPMDIDPDQGDGAHATKPSKRKWKKASASIGVSQAGFVDMWMGSLMFMAEPATCLDATAAEVS
jgi:hypothetical protein